MGRTGRVTVVAVVVAALVALVSASAGVAPRSAEARWSHTSTLTGTVASGADPVAFSRVTLYRTSAFGAPIVLATERADARGRFELRYRPPAGDPVLYVLARGGVLDRHLVSPRYVLASVLRSGPTPVKIVVDELTTVGSAYAMAQFVTPQGIRGNDRGMQIASAMVGHLADVETGALGPTVTDGTNAVTSTPNRINSLANVVAACADRPLRCAQLLNRSRPPGQSRPANTFEAVARIAANPWHEVDRLFALSTSQPSAPYAPALSAAPDSWTIAVKFVGDGHQFNGPGEIAFDADGIGWISNNYTQPDEQGISCASHAMMRLDPTVIGPENVTVYRGGGLSGAGLGAAVDTRGLVWIANFGFEGAGCQLPNPANRMTVFDPRTERFLSPVDGFQQGGISFPQGTMSDPEGNIWIANCANHSVTMYEGGRPNRFETFSSDQGFDKPFDLSIDSTGAAWVTANESNTVWSVERVGDELVGTRHDVALDQPMGIAVDSSDHKWISNSGLIPVPCTDKDTFAGDRPGTMVWLEPDGTMGGSTSLGAGGLTNPWGVAVDADDIVYVANFGRQRLTVICGTATEHCPRGLTTGDPISGRDGYGWDGLDRDTGVAVDQAGNVWLTNNWKTVPELSDPGGDGIVVFFGLAAPTKTPLLGTPQRP